MNSVNLIGRLTKDADLRYTPNGVAVARFTLAVQRSYFNSQNEKEVDFISCVAWRKIAENLANYTRKGSLVGVSGRIETRSYEDQQGNKRYVTEVIAESIQFLSSPNNRNNQNQDNQQNDNQNPYGNPDSFVEININNDEDLPF